MKVEMCSSIEIFFITKGCGDSCNIYLILAYTVFDVMNYLMDRVMLVEMS